MKKLCKYLIFLPIITLCGCSMTTKMSKEGPEPFKETRDVNIHIGTSPSGG